MVKCIYFKSKENYHTRGISYAQLIDKFDMEFLIDRRNLLRNYIELDDITL